LSEISKESKLSISELIQRFLKLFGDEYTKAAEKKFVDAKRKGTVFEEISLAYLKSLGFLVKDVRKRSIFEGSRKRPDFNW